jgi:hypothetical protein
MLKEAKTQKCSSMASEPTRGQVNVDGLVEKVVHVVPKELEQKS